MADGDRAPLQGVLAFGDSITHGGGTIQRNVVQESWALWVARGLGLPFTGFAVDAARLVDVLGEQIPASARLTARPDARYDLGLLYAGVNDVRRPDFDAAVFARDFRAALGAIAQRCERTLVLTLPRDLGRPRAAPSALERANAAIEQAAADAGSLVADLRDFGARDHVLADRIHPTAFGQIEIADRALQVLAAAGYEVLAWPAEQIRPAEPTALRRLGGEARDTARRLQVSTRAVAIRLLRRARA